MAKLIPVIQAQADLVDELRAEIEQLRRERDGFERGMAHVEKISDEWRVVVDRLTNERDVLAYKLDQAVNTVQPVIISRAEAAEAEVAKLRKAIADYLSGDFKNPRDYRPGDCLHGTLYWMACEQCIDAHFQAALAQPKEGQADG